MLLYRKKKSNILELYTSIIDKSANLCGKKIAFRLNDFLSRGYCNYISEIS